MTSERGSRMVLPDPPTAADLARTRMTRHYRLLVAIGTLGMLSGIWAPLLFPPLGSSIGGFAGAMLSLYLVFLIVMLAGMTLVVAGFLIFNGLKGYHLDPDMPGLSLSPRDHAWLQEVIDGPKAVTEYLITLEGQSRLPCRREVKMLRGFVSSASGLPE